MRRPLVLAAALLLAATACGGGGGPRATGDLPADAFTGQAEAVSGGTVDLGDFADQDLVVWFWSPW